MAAHNIQVVLEIVGNAPEKVIFSTKAKTVDACRRLGIPKGTMFQILSELKPSHFYKSEPDYFVIGEMLDIYYYDFASIPLYIKFKVTNEKKLIVTSMHERT